MPANRGSLPWLLLAGIIMTGIAVYLEATVLNPYADALTQTSAWANPGTTYAKQGMGMIHTFVDNILTVMVVGIWIGVFLLARWQI